MTDSYPLLGAIGVTPTFGNNLDRFVAKGIQWATATRNEYSHYDNATVNHAVVYVGKIAGCPKPQLVEARPHGSGFADWDKYGENMIWINHPYTWQSTLSRRAKEPVYLSYGTRQKIVSFAIDCAVKQVGYNFVDFVAIALAQQRAGRIVNYANPPWWVKVLSNDNRLICSQLVDYCYKKAGIQLFDDKRPEGLVSPSDLLFLKGNLG